MAMNNLKNNAELLKSDTDTPSDEQILTFLMHFAATGLPSRAAAAARMSFKTVRKLLKTNPSFFESYAEAYVIYRDSIVEEVHRRGVKGYDEVIVYKGEIKTRFVPETGEEVPLTVKKYDSALLQMEAKRVEPGYMPAQIDPNQPNRVHIPGLHIPGVKEDPEGDRLVLEFTNSTTEILEGDLEAVKKEELPIETSDKELLDEDFS